MANPAIGDDKKAEAGDGKSDYVDLSEILKKDPILQDAKCFNDKVIDDFKCIDLLSKIIFLINHGVKLTERETTDLFFAVTKLFQSSRKELRRLIYLFVKEMRIKETEVFIVVSSLTKDMNSSEYAFKSNSMKVLAKIIEPENLPAIERYMKQAIMDPNPYVVKGALLSGITLYGKATESIKKWSNEIQEKLISSDPQILYFSLILMAMIKSNDIFSLLRMVQTLAKQPLKGLSLAHCQLIREVKKLLATGDLEGKTQKALFEFLESSAPGTGYSDMVVIGKEIDPACIK